LIFSGEIFFPSITTKPFFLATLRDLISVISRNLPTAPCFSCPSLAVQWRFVKQSIERGQ